MTHNERSDARSRKGSAGGAAGEGPAGEVDAGHVDDAAVVRDEHGVVAHGQHVTRPERCDHRLGVAEDPLRGRCDSMVVKTNVHYPTDATWWLDAMRRLLKLCSRFQGIGLSGWRQYWNNYQLLRNLYLQAQRLRPSTAKNTEKVKQRQPAIRDAYQVFLTRCREMWVRIRETLAALTAPGQDPR